MAMFECPGCKNIVDDSIRKCPKCSYDIKKYVKQMMKDGKKNKGMEGGLALSSVYKSSSTDELPTLDFLKKAEPVAPPPAPKPVAPAPAPVATPVANTMEAPAAPVVSAPPVTHTEPVAPPVIPPVAKETTPTVEPMSAPKTQELTSKGTLKLPEYDDSKKVDTIQIQAPVAAAPERAPITPVAPAPAPQPVAPAPAPVVAPQPVAPAPQPVAPAPAAIPTPVVAAPQPAAPAPVPAAIPTPVVAAPQPVAPAPAQVVAPQPVAPAAIPTPVVAAPQPVAPMPAAPDPLAMILQQPQTASVPMGGFGAPRPAVPGQPAGYVQPAPQYGANSTGNPMLGGNVPGYGNPMLGGAQVFNSPSQPMYVEEEVEEDEGEKLFDSPLLNAQHKMIENGSYVPVSKASDATMADLGRKNKEALEMIRRQNKVSGFNGFLQQRGNNSKPPAYAPQYAPAAQMTGGGSYDPNRGLQQTPASGGNPFLAGGGQAPAGMNPNGANPYGGQ